MIPEFDDNGYLPAGLHRATLTEVLERFGTGNEQRQAIGESLGWLVELCKKAGIKRLVVNGSFVTDVAEPGDMDCVALAGAGYNPTSSPAMLIREGLPFVSIDVALDQLQWDKAVGFFADGRRLRTKGLVEVIL